MRRTLAPVLAACLLLTAGTASAQAEDATDVSEPAILARPAADQAAEIDELSKVLPGQMAASAGPEQAVGATPPAPPQPAVTLLQRAAVTLLLKADLTTQKVTVVEDGRVRHVWAISSGRRGYATPTGTFRPSWMAKMWRSRQYDNAPMPHAVFFNSGIAFHATAAVSMLGRPASHGCLRLAPAHAAELYALVRRHGLLNTKVVVQGTPSFQPATVAGRVAPAAKNAIAAVPPRGNRPVSRYGQPVAAAQWLFTQ